MALTNKQRLKWEQQHLDNIAKMTDRELFEETVRCAGGDDYDGCFTDKGQWEFDELLRAFRLRLTQIEQEKQP